MYGLWYIVFGLLAIAVTGGILWIVFVHKRSKYNAVYKAAYKSWVKTFDDAESLELKIEMDKAAEGRVRYDDARYAMQGVFWIPLIIGLFFVILSIFLPIGAKKDVECFKYQSEYVELAVENGSDLENIAITQTVIKQNKWLADAKANLATWGTWSRYYGTDLEELEPIIIER